ncbi:MAG: hypothetical protein WCT04_02985 [Planctomycetota bacterium]
MARLSWIPLLIIVACGAVRAEDPDAPARSADETVLQALPKVPTLTAIIGDGNAKTQTNKWVQELMKKKETKARVEIVLLKQKLITEQESQDVEEKERLRRKIAYDKAHGTLYDTPIATDRKKRTIRMKLEFQVPEIEMYRRLIDTYKTRAALASSVVDALTKLDRDNDGRLTADEYRDAACIFVATQRLFAAIDNDNDGLISLSEIEAAKNLPANAAAALTAGSNSKDATAGTLKIKGFDANSDGALTIAERKALSSAYLEVELKSQQDADAYQKLHDDLSTARQVTAAKFENLIIELAETK